MGSPCSGEVVNMLRCDILMSEFESFYPLFFRTITIGKDMNPRLVIPPPVMG